MGRYCSTRCRPLPKHGNAKGGTRADLGIYVRSTWEANYARYLNWLVANGAIRQWQYEPKTFEFAGIKRGVRAYTPDFQVVELDGREVFHEVKGYMDQKSQTRLKRMARYFPEVQVVVIQRKEMLEIKRKCAALIPTWEKGANDKL